tara:strand:- start:9221 stop:9397 length:177 start_codon:yes stop_codon:yes gene_type:complete
MPFTIPTYYASQFVKNASLYERRKVLKSSYTTQYLLTIGFIGFNMSDIVKSNKIISKI